MGTVATEAVSFVVVAALSALSAAFLFVCVCGRQRYFPVFVTLCYTLLHFVALCCTLLHNG